MQPLLTCLLTRHDLRLVLLACVICLASTWTALQLVERARKAAGRRQGVWLGAAVLVLGCGVWATHFVAMLGYGPGLPVSYALPLTVVSGFVGIVFDAAGLLLLFRSRRGSVLGGALIAAGTAGLHYTGTAALRVPGFITWDPGIVTGSLGAGLALALAAGGLGRRTFPAALLLTLSIAALHFGGMTAIDAVPSPLVAFEPSPYAQEILAVGVGMVALLVTCLAAVAAGLDHHLAHRAQLEADRLRTLTEASFEGVVLHDRQGILDVNGAAARLYGRPRDALIGRPIGELARAEHWETLARCFADPEVTRCEVELRLPDDSLVPVEILSRPLDQGGGPIRVSAIRDLRERRLAEERIRHLAHHDTLTGLPNRALFTDRLAQALALAERQGLNVGVLCLDLDRFKEVNDTHGHPVGDALLVKVAGILKGATREADTVARLGGDEFAIIQVGADHPEGAAHLAERLVQALTAPIVAAGLGLEIGTSIGVALFPTDSREPDELLVRADVALYRAKHEGRGTFRMFEAGMDTRLKDRRALEHSLRQAIAHDGLTLFYQPQADAATGQVLGFEALLRWPDPERGMVPPAEFVPLAEETGLIRPSAPGSCARPALRQPTGRASPPGGQPLARAVCEPGPARAGRTDPA